MSKLLPGDIDVDLLQTVQDDIDALEAKLVELKESKAAAESEVGFHSCVLLRAV